MNWLRRLKARWDYRKHDRPSEQGFLAWVMTMPPDATYSVYDAKTCALGLYVGSLGYEARNPFQTDDTFTYELPGGLLWRPSPEVESAVMTTTGHDARTYDGLFKRLSKLELQS